MNKEFRAWHTEAEEMFYPERASDAFRWKEDGQPVIIEQYTGLTDKNGSKIFEGDIVSLQWIHNYMGSIEFKYGSFCMVSANNELIVRNLGELFAHNIAVIGNVHQHPELLENK
jgi:uncharacterized phage protein (TIGR01671 family)